MKAAKSIFDFQSEYLHVGRKSEDWHFRDINILASGLTCLMDISSPYISKSDDKGFHLSIFTVQEACVELLIYWMCQKAGLKRKPGEAWMKELSAKCLEPIRDCEGVQIHLKVKKNRCGTSILMAVGSFEIVGHSGGLFAVELKGVMENRVN